MAAAAGEGELLSAAAMADALAGSRGGGADDDSGSNGARGGGRGSRGRSSGAGGLSGVRPKAGSILTRIDRCVTNPKYLAAALSMPRLHSQLLLTLLQLLPP